MQRFTVLRGENGLCVAGVNIQRGCCSAAVWGYCLVIWWWYESVLTVDICRVFSHCLIHVKAV